MADSTASASGVAAQDLTGDGIWEIMWNGSADGLLIIRGSDGKRLFNEPYTGSGTVMDYLSLGDVDGVAEGLGRYGALAADAQFPAPSVTLNPGASQTVQFTIDDLRFLLPGPYAFAVAARSQADGQIFAQDTAAFTVAPYEAVSIAWEPISQM